MLIEVGVFIDFRDKVGRTALFLAARSKFEKGVRYLLARGANSDLKSSNG